MRFLKKALAILIFAGMLLVACGRGGPVCPTGTTSSLTTDNSNLANGGGGGGGNGDQNCQTRR